MDWAGVLRKPRMDGVSEGFHAGLCTTTYDFLGIQRIWIWIYQDFKRVWEGDWDTIVVLNRHF